jgi:hypothetical protein
LKHFSKNFLFLNSSGTLASSFKKTEMRSMSSAESPQVMLAVEQLGKFGEPELNRSEGRAYWTLNSVCKSDHELLQKWHLLQQQAEVAGRRRTVLRAHVTFQLAQSAQTLGLPIEANIPIANGAILILGENVHNSDVPEWETVAEDWLDAEPLSLTPTERLARLPARYEIIKQPSLQDTQSLTTLWMPFGWNHETITNYIRSQQIAKFGFWFSGVRDKATGKLVSACMGQGADLAVQYIVEATEFGTNQNELGRGLCTAAVIALKAQIVEDSRMKLQQLPLIFSECSLTSRSDMVARKAGQTIPGLTEDHRYNPWQVLRRNVAVLDGHAKNDLYEAVPKKYQAAFNEGEYRYWRNFVVTTLSPENIENFYNPQACREILARIQPVTR